MFGSHINKCISMSEVKRHGQSGLHIEPNYLKYTLLILFKVTIFLGAWIITCNCGCSVGEMHSQTQ